MSSTKTKKKKELKPLKPTRAKSMKSPVALVVLDGWGKAPSGDYNAISLAKTPNIDELSREFGELEICASGACVGLSEGQMGNSEVGHLTIGAGRIIFQDLMRVNKEIESGRLASDKKLSMLLRRISRSENNSLHLLGLVSDGGVHSHINHLTALLKIAKDFGLRNVIVHVILDGRDTPPKSGILFVRTLLDYMHELGLGRIGTVSGRYYAMDRDNRWERTKLAYDAIVHSQGEHYDDPLAVIERSYSKGVNDEFVVPCVIDGYHGISDSDAVFIFNFRPDRARQLTRALAMNQRRFDKFDRASIPKNLQVLTMTIYDADMKGVSAILGREHVSNTLSNVLERNNIKQLRIAETEKYAHVTYFFNGLTEKPRRYEDRTLVPSAREVGTYDKKPEMSAEEITKKALSTIQSRKYGFILINYANVDMVGHSGNIKSTVKAVETVDRCLGEIYSLWTTLKDEGRELELMITADHGNAEKMFDSTTRQPHTAHTSNPVPLILVSKKWRLSLPDTNYKAGLIDIAPSVLSMFGLAKPKEMTGISLVKRVN